MRWLATASPQVVTETPAGPYAPSPDHHTPGACRGGRGKTAPMPLRKGDTKGPQGFQPQIGSSGQHGAGARSGPGTAAWGPW